MEVYGFKCFAKFLQLGYVFFKRRVLRASKRDLEREISTIVDHCKNFLSPIKIDLKFSGQEFSIHLFITVLHFSRAIKLYSLSTKSFQGIMNSASFDLSISALVLILDISGLTCQNQAVMQVVVN